MMILFEILLLLTTFFPLFHMIDALFCKKSKPNNSTKQLGFSILIPCFNESLCVEKSIESLLNMDYENFEVIFINDGSLDDTLLKIKKRLKLCLKSEGYVYEFYASRIYKNFFCINKPNTGKGPSLNYGITRCTKDIIITLDADSMLNPDCLKKMNDAFSDENVVAAGGAVHIKQAKNTSYFRKLNLIKRILVGIQAVDYLKGFFIYKLSLSKQKALAIISGAFGVFRKDVLLAVGGFRKSLGEDIDITIKIQRYIMGSKKKILFLTDAECYTECPENIRDLFRQRTRWQKGFIDCVVYNAKFLLRTFLTTPLSFYLSIEAFLVAYFSCLLPIISIIYLLFFFSRPILLLIIFYSVMQLLLNLIYTLIAYIIASKKEFPYPKKHIFAIFADIFVFRIFLLFIYLYGTVAYIINNKKWNKVERSEDLSDKELKI